ncbi:MAG: hypothetical protein ACRDTV_09750 [Mycobacterium sp.]
MRVPQVGGTRVPEVVVVVPPVVVVMMMEKPVRHGRRLKARRDCRDDARLVV